MKRIYITILSVLLTGSAHLNAISQNIDKQEFKVPLSDPGKPGKLKVGLHRGSIKIDG